MFVLLLLLLWVCFTFLSHETCPRNFLSWWMIAQTRLNSYKNNYILASYKRNLQKITNMVNEKRRMKWNCMQKEGDDESREWRKSFQLHIHILSDKRKFTHFSRISGAKSVENLVRMHVVFINFLLVWIVDI